MVNKKGWLRIVEVSVAVLIVISSVLIVLQGQRKASEQQFCNILPGLIDEVSKNDLMREKILDGNPSAVIDFLRERVRNPSFDFRVKICLPEEVCLLEEGGFEKVDVCTAERIVSTSQTQGYSPRKLKIFLFRI